MATSQNLMSIDDVTVTSS